MFMAIFNFKSNKEDIQSIEKYPYEHHHFQSDRRIMMALQHVAQHKISPFNLL